MSRKLLQCDDCEASFELKHDLDENYYSVTYCPFCATKLDLQDDLYEPAEDEDEW